MLAVSSLSIAIGGAAILVLFALIVATLYELCYHVPKMSASNSSNSSSSSIDGTAFVNSLGNPLLYSAPVTTMTAMRAASRKQAKAKARILRESIAITSMTNKHNNNGAQIAPSSSSSSSQSLSAGARRRTSVDASLSSVGQSSSRRITPSSPRAGITSHRQSLSTTRYNMVNNHHDDDNNNNGDNDNDHSVNPSSISLHQRDIGIPTASNNKYTTINGTHHDTHDDSDDNGGRANNGMMLTTWNESPLSSPLGVASVSSLSLTSSNGLVVGNNGGALGRSLLFSASPLSHTCMTSSIFNISRYHSHSHSHGNGSGNDNGIGMNGMNGAYGNRSKAFRTIHSFATLSRALSSPTLASSFRSLVDSSPLAATIIGTHQTNHTNDINHVNHVSHTNGNDNACFVRDFSVAAPSLSSLTPLSSSLSCQSDQRSQSFAFIHNATYKAYLSNDDAHDINTTHHHDDHHSHNDGITTGMTTGLSADNKNSQWGISSSASSSSLLSSQTCVTSSLMIPSSSPSGASTGIANVWSPSVRAGVPSYLTLPSLPFQPLPDNDRFALPPLLTHINHDINGVNDNASVHQTRTGKVSSIDGATIPTMKTSSSSSSRPRIVETGARGAIAPHASSSSSSVRRSSSKVSKVPSKASRSAVAPATHNGSDKKDNAHHNDSSSRWGINSLMQWAFTKPVISKVAVSAAQSVVANTNNSRGRVRHVQNALL